MQAKDRVPKKVSKAFQAQNLEVEVGKILRRLPKVAEKQMGSLVNVR